MKANPLGVAKYLNIKPSNCLIPVYEAISNAIHAIAEAKQRHKVRRRGSITVSIQRESTGIINDSNGNRISDGFVNGFLITDNGIGFDSDNFNAFQEAGTLRKSLIGGKGLGRFAYLACFEKAEIDSTFKINGSYKRRRFQFVPSNVGIEKRSVAKADDHNSGTSILLNRYKTRFMEKCPRDPETIALRLAEHFLNDLTNEKSPKIVVVDEDCDYKQELNRLVEKEFVIGRETDEFVIGEDTFKVQHVYIGKDLAKSHQIKLFAHGRPVLTEKINQKHTFNLGPFTHKETKREFYYCAQIQSEALDDTVSHDRTGFNLDSEPSSDNELLEQPSLRQIRDETIKSVKQALRGYVKDPKKKHLDRIKAFCKGHPNYRVLLKHAMKQLKQIPPGLSDCELSIELMKVFGEYKADAKRRFQDINAKAAKSITNMASFRKKYRKFLDEQNDLVFSELATYVLDRKAALDALQLSLEHNEEGKFKLEDAVHEIIFPLKSTSDDISYEDSNLWIIDERLAFHSYLASDRAFSTHSPLASKSRKRPDIAAYFDSAFAFGDGPSIDQFGAVYLVEFKRPDRDDYTRAENPHQQLEDYFEEIQKGTARGRNGRRLELKPDTPFFAFIVCDLTSKIRQLLERTNYKPLPDNEGYVFYHEHYKAFIQVVSYSKLLSDAKQRNQIFFEKLGIDSETVYDPKKK